VESAKNYLKGNLSLSLENTESRMVFLAKNEITFSKIVRLSDIFRGISNVLREDVISLSQEILSKNPVVVILGKPKKADYIKNIM
jgi:predicted Zn-dependent peptidase